MTEFMNQFSLSSILTSDEPTFHHHNGVSSSKIDHIMFSLPFNSDVQINMFKHLCIYENDLNLSAHDAILGTIKADLAFNKKDSETDYSSTYTDFQVNIDIYLLFI